MRKPDRRLAAALLLALPTIAVAASTPAAFKAVLADGSRPVEDVARDADRKPAQMMAFAGVRKGSRIAELAPGGGYFTRLLSLAVGAKGQVHALTGRAAPALEAWAANHPQVRVAIIKAGDALAPGPVDIVWTTQNYHDFKNAKVGDTDAAALYNAAAFRALKPGGVYLVNDHAAAVGAPADVTSTLHRIEAATVIREVEAAGFRLDASSNLLAHAADDHTQKVFETGVRGKTDQFLLRFVKPKR